MGQLVLPAAGKHRWDNGVPFAIDEYSLPPGRWCKLTAVSLTLM